MENKKKTAVVLLALRECVHRKILETNQRNNTEGCYHAPHWQISLSGITQ